MSDEKQVQQANPLDPTMNVRSIVTEAVERLDDLRKEVVKRIDERIDNIDEKLELRDEKYQVQFSDSKEVVNTAFIAQEKAINAALTGTKEAITKSDNNTDKRFDLLSEKIDGIVETISKNTGQTGLYVTQTDLNVALDNLSSKFEILLRPVVTFMNAQTGKSEGNATNWTQFGIIAGLVIALLKLFHFI